MVEMHGNAVLFRRRLQHAQALRHHFLADAVAGNDRDPICLFGAIIESFLVIQPACSGRLFDGLAMDQTADRRSCSTLQCNVDRPDTASLTIPAPFNHRPSEYSHGSASARQARPDHRRLQGHWRGRGRSLCRGRLPSQAGRPQRRAAEGADRAAAFAHQIDATAHVVDLRKPEDIQKLAKDAADIDILVNNAGDIPGGSIDKIDEPTWRHAWELKVFGYINLTRAIYAQMKARGHGVIVNDIGAAGEKFDANYICGSAGNAALMAFTRALGGKSLADNIRVVGINPGPVGTDRHVTLLKTRAKNQFGDENRYKEFQKGLPLGRPAHAREIGDLMAFLASDRSGYTSGVIFTVDGGIAAGWG